MAPIRRARAARKEATAEALCCDAMPALAVDRSAPVEVLASSAQPKTSPRPEDGAAGEASKPPPPPTMLEVEGVAVEPEPETEQTDDERDSLTVELERLFLSQWGVHDESCVVRKINDDVHGFERCVGGFVKAAEKLAFPNAGLAGTVGYVRRLKDFVEAVGELEEVPDPSGSSHYLHRLKDFAKGVGESANTLCESGKAAKATAVSDDPWAAGPEELRKRYPFLAEHGVFDIGGWGKNPQVDATMLQALEDVHMKAKMAGLAADWAELVAQVRIGMDAEVALMKAGAQHRIALFDRTMALQKAGTEIRKAGYRPSKKV